MFKIKNMQKNYVQNKKEADITRCVIKNNTA